MATGAAMACGFGVSGAAAEGGRPDVTVTGGSAVTGGFSPFVIGGEPSVVVTGTGEDASSDAGGGGMAIDTVTAERRSGAFAGRRGACSMTQALSSP